MGVSAGLHRSARQGHERVVDEAGGAHAGSEREQRLARCALTLRIPPLRAPGQPEPGARPATDGDDRAGADGGAGLPAGSVAR